ncbi:MAG: flagellar hook-length control protein FliK [Candidatus Gastranaerophilales bacterium]|nr:flagellar hook-length control protein FliK [Candidatus Gastranaerophilales bacterium]
MTSTAVKGVGNFFQNLTANTVSQAAQNKAGTMSFQNVLNSQTGKDNSPQAAQPGKAPNKATSPEQPDKAESSLSSPKADKVKQVKSDQPEGEEQVEMIPQDEQMQEAMEILGTAAMELIGEITDTLDISAEELNGLLGQMGLEAADLLKPENLSAFLLQAFGAEDNVALLTDEGMYADYKALMGELEQILESGPNDMTVADAYELMQQVPETVKPEAADLIPVKEEKPLENLIQVTVEEPEREETQELPADIQTNVPREAEQSEHTEGRRSDNRDHSEHGREHEGNSFMQNLTQLDPHLETAQTSEVSGGFDVDTQDIMRQIMDYMKLQVRPGMTDLEMQLHPESLGTLQIHLAAKGGVVTANFVAQDEAVKAALESQMVQLKESFAEQGVKVEAIEVTVQTHEFEQNLEQGRERGQEQNAAKGQRTRRIRLDDALSLEELEELPEEEQLAAKMMEANGNTVDFTA